MGLHFDSQVSEGEVLVAKRIAISARNFLQSQLTLKLMLNRGTKNQSLVSKSRLRLLQQMKREVQLLLGDEPLELKAYQKNYRRELKGLWSPFPEAEFLASLAKADVILSGDFHACPQSQRAHLRLMRSLLVKTNFSVAFECFSRQHDEVIEMFNSELIPVDGLRMRTNWDDRWGFPWSHYRPLFQFCRDHQVRISALESDPKVEDLSLRDRRMAERISELLDTSSRLFVVVGELHIADSHLPRQFRMQHPELRVSQVFQNSEQVFFQASSKVSETSQIWSQSLAKFCIMDSPPWMKWQSYLLFLEQSYDPDEEHSAEYDVTEHLSRILNFFAEDLGFGSEAAEKIRVFSDQDESLIELASVQLSEFAQLCLRQLLERGRSFLIPELKAIYIGRHSVNHISSAAGLMLLSDLAPVTRLFSSEDDFLERWIWLEAVGFFFSKLVNHRRKAVGLADLTAQSAKVHSLSEVSLKLSLGRKAKEAVWLDSGQGDFLEDPPPAELDFRSSLEMGRILGAMMGEDLFQSYRGGQTSKYRLIQLLKENPLDEAPFKKRYFRILQQLNVRKK